MVKLKGPGLSCGAHGSLADVLTFAENKGRPYVKKKTDPTNPRSGGQVGGRALIGFLSKYWSSLVLATRNTWNDLADAEEIAPYHAYLKYNQQRWVTGRYPSFAYPATLATNGASIGYISLEIDGFRVTFSIFPSPFADNWGIIAYSSLASGFTPSIVNAKTVRTWDVDAELKLVYGPLPIGYHYFRFNCFSDTGKPNTSHTTQYHVDITG